MKKLIVLGIALLMTLASCVKKQQEARKWADGVRITPTELTLLINKESQLTASVLPAEATNQNIIWSVLDKDIVSVDETGKIVALSSGVTYVVATSGDGTAKASCRVTVVLPDRYVISIEDEQGTPYTALWHYPAERIPYTVKTSDGKEHTFTWTPDNSGAVTVENSTVTFNWVPSTDPAYLYYASGALIISTEDTYKLNLPVCSNVLNGFSIAGASYVYGSDLTIALSESYAISPLWFDGTAPAALPASVFNLTSSQPEVVAVELSDATWSVRALAEGDADLTVTFPGDRQHLLAHVSTASLKTGDIDDLAQEDFEESALITVSQKANSSSTLLLSWTGGDPNEDLSRDWTVTLARDKALSNVVCTYTIPASSNSIWNGEQPCFAFSGLQPGTDYWFVAQDASDPEYANAPKSFRTASFAVVVPSATPASAGDILLAEDFSEVCWGGDFVGAGAGYQGDIATDALNSRTAASFVTWKPAATMTEQLLSKGAYNATSARLRDWAIGANDRVYMHPGFLKLGYATNKQTAHVVTPALDNIPEGKSATLKVTVTACAWAANYIGLVAVQHGNAILPMSNASGQTNTLDLTTNVQTFAPEAYTEGWKNYEMTLTGVVKGDRIAVGSNATVSANGRARIILDAITIQLVSLSE